ncbi:DUF2750 domain-containing protein [Marinobacterium arenosum]|uniref:DUF2750 domain-containing protein n=1 Tax=Marinobacterium arenosum TaxID=2862496 RepID=UPI001C961872|nr:DUF2750 domain-containing protein [Marinobacterium arenosum]MBY4675457.1 DUF2750 domain-containing protein [Marinobacterium arenosum]
MAYKLTDEQRQSVLKQDAEQRYNHFLDKITKWEEVWSLRDDEGFVLVNSDDEACIPVWPHPDYAAEWASDEWAGCEPFSIKLDVWMERWLPGLTGDAINVAVFPSLEEEGVVEGPHELGEAIFELLEQ